MCRSLVLRDMSQLCGLQLATGLCKECPSTRNEILRFNQTGVHELMFVPHSMQAKGIIPGWVIGPKCHASVSQHVLRSANSVSPLTLEEATVLYVGQCSRCIASCCLKFDQISYQNKSHPQYLFKTTHLRVGGRGEPPRVVCGFLFHLIAP